MSVNIRETRIAFGKKKQSALQTANILADFWALSKTNPSFATVNPINEDNAQDIGKGHEFATQLFPSHFEVSGTIEKFLSSQFLAWLFAFGLGGVTEDTDSGVSEYTIIPSNPVVAGIDLPSFSYVEAIRQGGSAVLDRMLIGNVIQDFSINIESSPGRQSARAAVNFVGCGKIQQPSGITIPTLTPEHSLSAGSVLCTINGFNYVTTRNFVSMEIGWNNNVRLDSGFFPGSGTQNNFQIRGRMEHGDRAATLTLVARFAQGSPELTSLLNQSTGTAVLSLTGGLIGGGPETHGVSITFHKVGFRTAPLGDTDGLVTVSIEFSPMWDDANGLLTVVATTDVADIAA